MNFQLDGEANIIVLKCSFFLILVLSSYFSSFLAVILRKPSVSSSCVKSVDSIRTARTDDIWFKVLIWRDRT